MSKTIKIDPQLFNLGGNTKTKKREKKSKPIISPLITPNSLKNKLLKRIKEHKKDELKPGGSNEKKTDIGMYTEEFNDSIEYLKSLSDAKKNGAILNSYASKTPANKSLKHQSLNQKVPEVHLGLPDILKETIPVYSPPIVEPAISLTNKPATEPPWGILKGGKKKTYREWNRTMKNHAPTTSKIQLLAPVNEDNSSIQNEREQRLNELKEKIKTKQQEKTKDNLIMTTNFIQNKPDNDISIKIDDLVIEPISLTIMDVKDPDPQKTELIQKYKQEDNVISSRRLIKRTIKRKYTIGKSKIKNQVGILIKDRNTRKNILSAQLDLRKKPLNEVKTYLRNHALIKVGSNAPNDVVRKIYESSMLSGEITNNNEDTLLHNFLKDKDAE